MGGTFSEGLVDAESESAFYVQLEDFKNSIATKEIENPGASKGFFEWFCQHKVDTIVSGMLKPVRQEAGLGLPPSTFTTNTCESINAVLKRKVDFKKNELPTFVTHLKQLAEEQEREVERTVVGRGKYQFVEEYQFLEVKEVDWFRMTKEQRKKHMHKVATAQLKSGVVLSEQASCSLSSVQMSVSAEEFQEGLKIPLPAVKAIWRKAEELACNSNALSPTPGYDETCKMVMSHSGKCPHLVTSSKKGKYTCDNDCPNFKSMGICSHTVAVAHVNGSLKEFCTLYRKSKHAPSMSKLLLSGVPSGVGNKGNRVSKKRKRELESFRVPLSVGSSAAEAQPGPSHDALVTPVMEQVQFSGAYPSSCKQSTVLQPPPGMSEFSMTPTQPMVTPSMQCGTNQGTIHFQSPTNWNAPCYSYQPMNPH